MSNCGGNGGKNLITTCSGASDVGFLGDRVARMLSVAGKGSMYCLAGLGAGMEGFIEGTKKAGRNIVIDGCPVQCGKKIMDNHGMKSESYVVTSFGFKKGEAGISDETTKAAFLKIQEAIDKNTPSGVATISGGGCSCGS